MLRFRAVSGLGKRPGQRELGLCPLGHQTGRFLQESQGVRRVSLCQQCQPRALERAREIRKHLEGLAKPGPGFLRLPLSDQDLAQQAQKVGVTAEPRDGAATLQFGLIQIPGLHHLPRAIVGRPNGCHFLL